METAAKAIRAIRADLEGEQFILAMVEMLRRRHQSCVVMLRGLALYSPSRRREGQRPWPRSESHAGRHQSPLAMAHLVDARVWRRPSGTDAFKQGGGGNAPSETAAAWLERTSVLKSKARPWFIRACWQTVKRGVLLEASAGR